MRTHTRRARFELRAALAASIALHLTAFALAPEPRSAPAAAPRTAPPPVLLDLVAPPPVPPPPPPLRHPRAELGIEPALLAEPSDPEVSAAEPSPEPPPVPVRSSVGPSFRSFEVPPRAVRRVRPEYPPAARATGIEGVVVLEVRLDERGRVVAVRVLRADSDLLISPAVEAVSAWTFEPARQSGAPVPSILAVPLRFVLGR